MESRQNDWNCILFSGNYPELYVSSRRYRLVGWKLDRTKDNKTLQTYDLLTGITNRINDDTPEDKSGWKPGLLSDYNNECNHKVMPEIKLDGIWKTINKKSYTGFISADGPFKLRKWSYDVFRGDIVILMNKHEILRQRVYNLTKNEVYSKIKSHPDHDLLVYKDGLPGEPGTALFLDLTLGHPFQPQGPNELFPGRVNTLPHGHGLTVYRLGEYTPMEFMEKKYVGKPYLLKLDVSDPDLEFGDEITGYEWDLGSSEILRTRKPEIIHTFKRPGEYCIKTRGFDKSQKAGPWYSAIDTVH